MNKESLISKGKKLSNGLVYVINIFDLEPSGIIVQAYSQMDSKERILPISEKEVFTILIYVFICLFVITVFVISLSLVDIVEKKNI